MNWQIPQHIFTSTGRVNFETVAVTPSLSDEIIKQIEARARSYPIKRSWEGEPPTPPFVARGFRLIGGGEFDYAVSLLFYVGASLTSAEGNYLSHCYAIPRDLLAHHNYNLPWIAACLPCHFEYRPARGSGADALDPLAFNLDPARQFSLFSFVARELTAEVLHDLMPRLVAHIEQIDQEQSLTIELPPPHAELGRIYQEVMGKPQQASPRPDALRLLRLAGALAILPTAFKQNLTFTVNDSIPLAANVNSDAYAVRVARMPSVTPPQAQADWPWLDHCIRLAANNQLEQLEELHAYLSKLLSSDCNPSRRALDLSFSFYRDLVAGQRTSLQADVTSPRPANIRTIIKRLADFKKCDVNADAMYETLLPLLQPKEMSYEDHCNLNVALCEIVTVGKALPAQVLTAVRDCLRITDGQKEETRRQFWRSLPKNVRAHLWERTFLDSDPPGRIPFMKGRPDPNHLSFALTLFSPGLLTDNPVCTEIINHLAECIQYRSNFSYDVEPSRKQLYEVIDGLNALIKFPVGDKELLKKLVTILAQQFFTALEKSDYEIELKRIVLNALDKSSALALGVLAEFTCRVAIREEGAVLRLMLNLPLTPQDWRQVGEFLNELDGRIPSVQLQLLIRTLKETLKVVDKPYLCDTDLRTDRVLAGFNEWLSDLRNRLGSGSEGLYSAFLEQLLVALKSLPIESRFCVGVTYLYLSQTRDDRLFNYIMDMLERSGHDIAIWCVADERGIPKGRGRTLARVLIVADRKGSSALGRAYKLVEDALLSLSDPTKRRVLLIQLNHYLAESNISGKVKRVLRDHAERLGGPHRR